MKLVYKKIFTLAGITIILFIVSTVGYTIFNTSDDTGKTGITEKKGELTTSEAKETTTETTGKNSRLTIERLKGLYDKGYGVIDIETANELSILYDMDIEKVLEIKGIPNYKQKNGDAGLIIDEGGRTWNDIRGELSIKKAIKENGASEEEINEAVSSFRKQVVEKSNSNTESSKTEAINSEEFKKNAVTITKEDIEKCRQYNVLKINEIVKAKKYALKYNVTLDNILKTKKEQVEWVKVNEVLGGWANE